MLLRLGNGKQDQQVQYTSTINMPIFAVLDLNANMEMEEKGDGLLLTEDQIKAVSTGQR